MDISRSEELLAQEVATKSITIAKYQAYVEELQKEIEKLKEAQASEE
ncbi:hypothetical protein [Staphylococcus canis]|uniref:Phage protein n=1 Tax=Staphylococcus canis TaxID=2724942 RepID=A0ABS0T9H9_9STAP|nr:hypothetical protein [Staphylococcus canis]MBI5975215.1 hypothetical protein [Staphylococcus canis]